MSKPKETPKAWWEINPNGHVWRKYESGMGVDGPDSMAYSSGIHNGPVCEVCGYGFCEHCLKEIDPCPGTRAEIEAKKTVPMAMLWDIFSTNGGSREIFCDIAARYGYEVTE